LIAEGEFNLMEAITEVKDEAKEIVKPGEGQVEVGKFE